MKCPVCHANSVDAAAFCQHCGAKLPLAGPDETVTSSLTETFEPDDRDSQSEAKRRDPSDPSGGRRRGIVDVPEETLWEGTFSPKAMIGTAVLCAIATVALLVVALAFASGGFRAFLLAIIPILWVVVALRLAARRLGVSYKLTNQMFYHRRGVLTRSTDRIELIEVHDVTYQQGLFDRLVDVGRIKIASGDRTDPIFFVRGVENVETVAQLIDKARRGEQVRRGRRIDFSHIDGET